MSYTKISIVIPIYNSEKYLEKCLNSILFQNYNNYEVILINDGSQDKSGRICDEYVSKDDRFHVFHIKNGGVSNARNYGLSQATGNYITFIDSDDYIEPDFLYELSKFTERNYDIIQSGLSFFNEESILISSEILPDKEFCFDSNKNDVFEIATIKLITSPCCKLYKRNIIKDNNLKFDTTLSYGEDRDFNIRYLKYVHNALSLSYVGYHYRKGISTSLSQDKDYEKLLRIDLDYWRKLFDFLKWNNCSTQYESYLATRLYHFYNDRLSQIISSKNMNIIKVYSYISKIFRSEEFNWLHKNIKQVKTSTLMYISYKYKITLLSAILYYKNK